jgi:hypothetical protein
MNKLAIIFFFH